MEYNKLVSVTGMPGLFELLSSKADGGVVKSLEDKSSKFVSNRIHSFTSLDGIEVYTTKDNVALAEVFMAMQESKEAMPEGNADLPAIKDYFSKVFPSMDFERVYASDMKKMIKWFQVIKKNEVEIKLPSAGDEDEVNDSVPEKKTASKQSNPKAAAIKNAPAKKINSPRKMA
ncbi:MAG: DUF5606 domain-containing protein [Ferruginibacter sp.]